MYRAAVRTKNWRVQISTSIIKEIFHFQHDFSLNCFLMKFWIEKFLFDYVLCSFNNIFHQNWGMQLWISENGRVQLHLLSCSSFGPGIEGHAHSWLPQLDILKGYYILALPFGQTTSPGQVKISKMLQCWEFEMKYTQYWCNMVEW